MSRSALSNLAGYHDEVIASHTLRLEKYDASQMFEKKGNERPECVRHRRRAVSRGMHRRDSLPSRCMHERAARRRLDIQGGGRGWVAHPPLAFTSTPCRPTRKSREPPIFSYRILVCVHARRAINGKILESHSGNPDTGFHGSVLRLSWIGRSALSSRARALRSLNLFSLQFSPRFRSALFPARPSPAFLLTTLKFNFRFIGKKLQNVIDLSEVTVW